MMKKVATIAALAMMAPTVMGACEATNWVTDSININSAGGASNAVNTADATILTCASLKTAGSCCAKTEIAKFQGLIDTVSTTLETGVKTRDQYILDRRGDVLGVRDSLSSIQSSLTSLGDSGLSLLTAFLGSYETVIEEFTENFDDLKAGFITLQKNRVTCFDALLKAQVTIWCAGCAETLATAGLDTATSTVSYGTTFTNYLANACSAYVASAAEQSGILSLYAVSDYLAALASALEKLVNGDTAGFTTEITEFLTDYAAITDPTNVLQQAGIAPTTCTTTDCTWASDLLTSGSLLTNTAIVGGILPTRRLQQDAPAGRMLQVNSDPSTEAAGITVAFPENPGNVDNDQNSAVRNGAIACAITALAALF